MWESNERPQALTAISTGTGTNTKEKVLHTASEKLEEKIHLQILLSDLFANDAKYHHSCLACYISERNTEAAKCKNLSEPQTTAHVNKGNQHCLVKEKKDCGMS